MFRSPCRRLPSESPSHKGCPMFDPLNPEVWFAKHLAALELAYTVKHVNKPKERTRLFYSGFLLRETVPGTEMVATMWVTAGHCMEQIDRDVLGNPDAYSDIQFRFIDTLHAEKVSDIPFSFDYQGERYKSYLYHKDENGVELGFDFGVIFLRHHYTDLFLGNKLEPVDEENWTNLPEMFDHYFMLGLPEESVQGNEQGGWTVQPKLIEIQRLHEKPARYQEHTDPMIYGVVASSAGVNSVKGMSGGPILGLKRNDDGTGRYWFIGVQSGWYPPERIVCASSLEAVRAILRRGIERIFGNAQAEV